jgi:hypothetical protein
LIAGLFHPLIILSGEAEAPIEENGLGSCWWIGATGWAPERAAVGSESSMGEHSTLNAGALECWCLNAGAPAPSTARFSDADLCDATE